MANNWGAPNWEGADLVPFGRDKTALHSAEHVGGKGAHLIEMCSLGLNVPPGVIIPASVCAHWRKQPMTYRHTMLDLLSNAVENYIIAHDLSAALFSVRSGARVSMPGMMDTILNVGLTKANHWFFAEQLGEKCAADCAERLISMYAKSTGSSKVPETRLSQLRAMIAAVFNSWDSERAREYRKLHGYSDDWGTAVVIQAMVFGNRNEQSCSGVLFTRDPATGEDAVTGEFLPNAQGEDVVAGTRTPLALHEMEGWDAGILDQLLEISGRLELHYKEAQDIEFTVDSGELFILQTRRAKRTAAATFKIAHDLAVAGIIKQADAVKRVTFEDYRKLSAVAIDPAFDKEPDVVGLAASPGIVTGPAVFKTEAVKPGCILVREETTPDDFSAMVQSGAILTARGGATSHAAVVARGINKPAVVGADGIVIEALKNRATFNGDPVWEGDVITIDGATGRVWRGAVPTVGGALPPEAKTIVDWAIAKSTALPVARLRGPESLPARGRHYLSFVNLTDAKSIRAVLKALAGGKDAYGLIGFGNPRAALTKDDQQFLTLLSLTGVSDDAADMAAFVQVATSKAVPAKLKKRWTVHPPMSAKASELHALRDAGWRLVARVNTLDELCGADGYVEYSEDFRKRIHDVEVKSVLKLLDNLGRKVGEIGTIVEPDDLLREALGK